MPVCNASTAHEPHLHGSRAVQVLFMSRASVLKAAIFNLVFSACLCFWLLLFRVWACRHLCLPAT